MTNNVGELFKELGSNAYVKTHILEGMDFDMSNDEIAEMITYDDMIMDVLNEHVDDGKIVLEKLKIFVGQQVKKISAANTAAAEQAKEQQNVSLEVSESQSSLDITEDDLFDADDE
jgi:hypothetical protein